MFDSGYSFHLVDKKSFTDNDLVSTYYFNFRGKRRYIALVEEYVGEIFVIKFYPHSHLKAANKYNVLVDDFDAPRVIRTAIDIMLHVLKGHPGASFGFLASSTITESYSENIYYNKRFRIYSRLMAAFFSMELFYHIENENISAYLLMNKCHTDIDEFTDKALKMFIRNYPDLETEL